MGPLEGRPLLSRCEKANEDECCARGDGVLECPGDRDIRGERRKASWDTERVVGGGGADEVLGLEMEVDCPKNPTPPAPADPFGEMSTEPMDVRGDKAWSLFTFHEVDRPLFGLDPKEAVSIAPTDTIVKKNT